MHLLQFLQVHFLLSLGEYAQKRELLFLSFFVFVMHFVPRNSFVSECVLEVPSEMIPIDSAAGCRQL
jgi:hypothetical protein